MRIDEVVITEVSDEQREKNKELQDLYIQRRLAGQGIDTKSIGSQMGHSLGTGVEIGDLTNVQKKGTTDQEVSNKATGQASSKAEPKKDPADSGAQKTRRKRQDDILRGRGKRGDQRYGSDGRQLRHDKYYVDKEVDRIKDYDYIVPGKDTIKKAGKAVKNTVASFIRKPSDTMANLRYKFKDLLQK